MQLARIELFLQCLINALLPLHAILAGEFGTDDQSLEMLSIAIQRQVIAGHASENELLDLIRVHMAQALNFQPRRSKFSVNNDTAARQATTTSKLFSGGTSETPKKP